MGNGAEEGPELAGVIIKHIITLRNGWRWNL